MDCYLLEMRVLNYYRFDGRFHRLTLHQALCRIRQMIQPHSLCSYVQVASFDGLTQARTIVLHFEVFEKVHDLLSNYVAHFGCFLLI